MDKSARDFRLMEVRSKLNLLYSGLRSYERQLQDLLNLPEETRTFSMANEIVQIAARYAEWAAQTKCLEEEADFLQGLQ